MDWGVVFEVFEKGGDRHTGAAEQPRTAVSFGVLLDRIAGGPVNHKTKYSIIWVRTYNAAFSSEQ